MNIVTLIWGINKIYRIKGCIECNIKIYKSDSNKKIPPWNIEGYRDLECILKRVSYENGCFQANSHSVITSEGILLSKLHVCTYAKSVMSKELIFLKWHHNIILNYNIKKNLILFIFIILFIIKDFIAKFVFLFLEVLNILVILLFSNFSFF